MSGRAIAQANINGLQLQKPGFGPRPDYVGTLMDRSPAEYFGFPFNISSLSPKIINLKKDSKFSSILNIKNLVKY